MDPSEISSLPRAADWSLIAGSAGKWAIGAGIVLFLLTLVFACIGDAKPWAKLRDFAFYGGAACLFLAFGILGSLFLKNQFQFDYVFSHSEIDAELKYKVAAIWSGQQGSFLLWACTSGLFGLLAIRGTGIYRRWFVAAMASFLGCICGILAYETPFNLIKDVVVDGVVHVPPTGQGMEPSLINYWVVVHPPVIFLGFGSLAVMFAYAVSAMLTGNVSDYVSRVRPWSLVSMAILGLGVVMGGLWAYETQGWGGFWAWDPVENVSFVPWLFVVSLLHGYLVQATRRRWVLANLIMGGAPFLVFVYGTFLTRSGLLTDVSTHSFASMDKSASKILVWFLGAVVVLFSALVAWKGVRLARGIESLAGDEGGASRESLFKFGTLMVSLLAIVIALGMSWPVLSALFGGRVTKVEEALYHKVVAWFFIPAMLLMGAAPFASWRDLGWRALGAKLTNVLTYAIGITGFAILGLKLSPLGRITPAGETVTVLGLQIPQLPWVMFLVFLCIFSVVANIVRIVEMFRKTKMGLGGFVAHVGIAVLLGGLILSRGLEQKQQILVQEGVPQRALDYTVSYKSITGNPQDKNNKAEFSVTSDHGESFTALPGLYYLVRDGEQKAMTWPFIQHYPSHDVYLALSSPVMSAWKKPEMFAVNEERTVDDFKIKNKGVRMVGQPGQEGTRFVADVEVTYVAPTEETRKVPYANVKVDASPELKLGPAGTAPTPSLTSINQDFMIVMNRMDAASRSVELDVMLKKPIFPIELYYKPMTLLVWVGAGILFIGGLMAAIGRWFKPTGATPTPTEESSLADIEAPAELIEENAPVPVA